MSKKLKKVEICQNSWKMLKKLKNVEKFKKCRKS